MTTPTALRLGTRTSALARWQTDYVAGLLRAAWPSVTLDVVPFTTTGDRTLDRPLPEIGGKGVFTQELERALLDGQIDLAVHSLKDLPVEEAPGLMIGSVCPREDARDALLSGSGLTLAQLPRGARVGTSSLRRAAQLLAARPDLLILPLRGNVDTRVTKALRGDYDAIVLAAAGVVRLGLQRHISQRLPFEVMLPAPGQGAVAVQCRAGDDMTRALLQAIHDPLTHAAVTTERAFLAALGGGCAAPVAAYAECESLLPRGLVGRVANGHSVPREDALRITLSGLVASPDGRHVIRVQGKGNDPAVCGADLARQALDEGAAALLAEVTQG